VNEQLVFSPTNELVGYDIIDIIIIFYNWSLEGYRSCVTGNGNSPKKKL